MVGATASRPPAQGTVLYAGKLLKAPTCSGPGGIGLDLRVGAVVLDGLLDLEDGTWILQNGCSDPTLSPSYSRSLLSAAAADVGTLESCVEAVAAAPENGVDLEDGQGLCVVGPQVAAHLLVVEVGEGAVTYEVTGWSRG